MQNDEPAPTKRMLRASHLTERYRVTPRTIDRWKNTQVLPPPDLVINKVSYWFETTIERNERDNLSARNRNPGAA
jgi:hypothetical protein